MWHGSPIVETREERYDEGRIFLKVFTQVAHLLPLSPGEEILKSRGEIGLEDFSEIFRATHSFFAPFSWTGNIEVEGMWDRKVFRNIFATSSFFTPVSCTENLTTLFGFIPIGVTTMSDLDKVQEPRGFRDSERLLGATKAIQEKPLRILGARFGIIFFIFRPYPLRFKIFLSRTRG